MNIDRVCAEINLKNIEHNFREIKRITKGADIIAVIKADGYGHGAVPLARLYEKLGATIFAVACINEAIELRSAGISLPILILGPTDAVHTAELLKYNLTQSVCSLAYAKALSDEAGKLSAKLKVHIKLDTGMTRLGLYTHKDFEKTAADDAEKIAKLPFLYAEGIFTHFCESEIEDKAYTDAQFDAFMSTVDELKARGITFNFCHCANSGAVVNYKRGHLNCVRPGLILYGISPTNENPEGVDLRPAMTFRSMVADVRHIKKGDYVSYNRTYQAERDMKIAVVSCGYADGLHRSLSRCGEFKIHGKRAKIIGNVCMDLTVVDVTDIPDVKQFDPVIIYDSELIYDQAKLAGTITYELMTSVSKRVPRTYISPDA